MAWLVRYCAVVSKKKKNKKKKNKKKKKKGEGVMGPDNVEHRRAPAH